MADPQKLTTEQAADDETDEHGHPMFSDVERVEHGFAPLLDQGDRRSREAREAAAYDAIGDDLAPELQALRARSLDERAERDAAGRRLDRVEAEPEPAAAPAEPEPAAAPPPPTPVPAPAPVAPKPRPPGAPPV